MRINISFKDGALEKIAQANVDKRASGEGLRELAAIYDLEGNRVLDIGIHGDVWPGGHMCLFEHAAYETLDIDPLAQPTHVADIRDMPFEDETFDFIICHSVIEHVLENRDAAYSELFRVLKEGGAILYVIPMQIEEREVEPAKFVSITHFKLKHKGIDYTIDKLPDRTYFIVVRK